MWVVMMVARGRRHRGGVVSGRPRSRARMTHPHRPANSPHSFAGPLYTLEPGEATVGPPESADYFPVGLSNS
jgi:hypothetical protein